MSRWQERADQSYMLLTFRASK